ncbi:MAG: type II toxin-antitoxin system RelE/ParE family toxin [Treponema sp.]|nr:type II toxin-antitoxin system RelE/ParE family toxin [Treponema sp.]
MSKEWHALYYFTHDNLTPVKEYIDGLSLREQAKTMAFIALLEEMGPNLPRPYADILKDGIHELRIKLKGTQVRMLYFFCYRNVIVLTNAFDKHTSEVPKAEIESAKDRRADFLGRFSENDIRGLL